MNRVLDIPESGIQRREPQAEPGRVHYGEQNKERHEQDTRADGKLVPEDEDYQHRERDDKVDKRGKRKTQGKSILGK